MQELSAQFYFDQDVRQCNRVALVVLLCRYGCDGSFVHKFVFFNNADGTVCGSCIVSDAVYCQRVFAFLDITAFTVGNFKVPV